MFGKVESKRQSRRSRRKIKYHKIIQTEGISVLSLAENAKCLPFSKRIVKGISGAFYIHYIYSCGKHNKQKTQK